VRISKSQCVRHPPPKQIRVHRLFCAEAHHPPAHRFDLTRADGVAEGDVLSGVDVPVNFDDELCAVDSEIGDIGADGVLAFDREAIGPQLAKRLPRILFGRVRRLAKAPRACRAAGV